MKLLKSILAIAVATAYSSAIAQEDSEVNTNSDGDAILEEVVVLGTRAALENALQTKRNYDTIVDGISADSMGRFPDLNLSESLQRITGVQMDYSGDEGERRSGLVALRGLPPEYALTTVNGQLLAAPEADKGFSFGTIASEVISAVNVVKSPTADMDAGGISGTVNVITKKALDLKDDFLALSMKSSYETNVKDFEPGYTLSGGKLFDDGKWGIVGSVSASDTNFRGDTARINTYSASDSNGDGSANLYTPSEIRILSRQTVGDRVSATLGVEFQATDELKLGLNGIYVSDDYTHDWQMLRVRKFKSTEAITTSTNGGAFGETVSEFYAVGPEVRAQKRTIPVQQKIEGITADFEWSKDMWTISGSIHDTSATYDSVGYMARRKISANAENGIKVRVNTGSGNINDFAFQEVDGDLANLTTYDGASWSTSLDSGHEYDTDQSEIAFQFDVKREFEGFMTSLQAGVKRRELEQTKMRPEWKLDSSIYDYTTVDNTACMESSANGNTSPGGGYFMGALDSQVDDWYFPNPSCVEATLLDGNPVTGATYGGLPAYEGESLIKRYSDSERDITATYLMARFDGANLAAELPIRGNVGVRYVDTSRTVGAYRKGLGDPIYYTADHDFSHVLPSLNLVWDISEDLLLRASFAETISRPHQGSDSYQVGQAIDIEDDGSAVSISLGNPELEPFEGESFDLSLEWYNRAGSSVSAAYFTKTISNGFDNRTLCPTNLTDITALSDIDLGTATTGSLALNSSNLCVDTNGVEVSITDSINTSGSFDISGWEIGVLQNFDFVDMPVLRNMGVQANYTLIDADESGSFDASGNALPLSGVSEDTYNLIVFYETDSLGVRAAYTSRSDYFDETWATVSGDNRFIEPQNRLDIYISYRPTAIKNLTLTLEGFNMTDEQFYAYQGSTSRAREYREVGKTYALTANYSF
jgi:iron complex outermembrane receptor protein